MLANLCSLDASVLCCTIKGTINSSTKLGSITCPESVFEYAFVYIRQHEQGNHLRQDKIHGKTPVDNSSTE